MILLAADGVLAGIQSAFGASLWLAEAELLLKAMQPGVWLWFSMTYSRGAYREVLHKRWYFLVAAILIPAGLVAGYHGHLFTPVSFEGTDTPVLRCTSAAKLIYAVSLLVTVVVLMNLEQTLRSAIGTMRWRVKFVVLGLAVIFGARIYTVTDMVLYSYTKPAMPAIEAVALLIGCLFMTFAYLRQGFAEIEIYPSAALLQSSATIFIAGGYLLLVGLLAQAVVFFGGEAGFEFRALMILLALAVLGVMLLSERFRRGIKRWVAAHLHRPQHDSRKVWMELSRRISDRRDPHGLCEAAVKVISETFGALSVNLWLVEKVRQRLVLGASTSRLPGEEQCPDEAIELPNPRALPGPFDLDRVDEPWAAALRRRSEGQFGEGGHRICLPLSSGDSWLGMAILADRVNGDAYSVEEVELLKCMGDQIAAGLHNMRLATEVSMAREMEAFRTMSAFFVHDLKNAASALNLTLKNLPMHFENPDFRADALRSIGNTARRIDDLVGRLSALPRQPNLKPEDSDLNELVSEALNTIAWQPDVELSRVLHPLPRILADRGQIRSVVTNLVANAQDALNGCGRIQVQTDYRDERVVLSVADNGCGMSPAFVRESLFHPFRSTKKRGLGIGAYQCRMIVEAHGGSIHVESETGNGTTFRVSLPARGAN